MPDLAEATNIAVNVIALTPQSYGPLPSLAQYSTNALEGNCIGMGFGEDSSPLNHIFAGTSTNLEILTAGSFTWSDVTGTTYAAAAGESWRFAQYDNLEIATDYSDPIQVYDMIAGGAFGPLTPGPFDSGNNQAAPNARHMAVAKTFLILLNTNDPVGGANPARVWWSAAGAPEGVVSGGMTGWPVPGSALAQQTQSDYNDLVGPQGQGTGLAPNLASCDCAVFFERGVFTMFYVGPPDIFNFYPASAVRGCPASNSIVVLGGIAYYYGEDGWYAFDGSQSTPIGANKVDLWFAANVDPSAYNLIVGAPDIANKAIIWIFRSVYAPTATQDQLLIYRWDIQQWTTGAVATQWIARTPVPTSPATGPDNAGQLELAAISGTPAAAPGPLLTETGLDLLTESLVVITTEATFASFMCFFTGPPLPAQVGSKVVQITPGRRSFIGDAVRPLVNSGGSGLLLQAENGLTLLQETGYPILTELSGALITVALSARQNYYDQEVFGPEVAPNSMGNCPQRSDGRYHRGRISIPSGVWTTMFGIDAEGIPSGWR